MNHRSPPKHSTSETTATHGAKLLPYRPRRVLVNIGGVAFYSLLQILPRFAPPDNPCKAQLAESRGNRADRAPKQETAARQPRPMPWGDPPQPILAACLNHRRGWRRRA